MNKTIVGTVLVAVIAGIAIYALNRPEPVPPTPKERLVEAAEDIREATKEAVEAASDAAEDAGEALASSANDKVDEMKAAVADTYADLAEQMAQTSQETMRQLNQLLADWKASGIVADGRIDFNKAAAAVEASDLSADAKANVISVLTALRNAPGAIKERLDALETLLNT